MKVKFLEKVNISDKVTIFKGEEYEAREDGDFIMIRMEDDSTIKAPKSEINGILEIQYSIKELRESKNMSMFELASKANVSPAGLSRIESGIWNPKKEILDRIYGVLNN